MFLVEKGVDCVFSVFSLKVKYVKDASVVEHILTGMCRHWGPKEALHVYLGSLQVEESLLALNMATKMASSANLK